MSRRRRNETEEQRARRELISDFLSAANIQSMDDIQELFKEALSGFMESSCIRRRAGAICTDFQSHLTAL